MSQASAEKPEVPPFERSIFEALHFDASQVLKADVSIGRRSQTVTFKLALTSDQVDLLNAMASSQPHDQYDAVQLARLADDGGIPVDAA